MVRPLALAVLTTAIVFAAACGPVDDGPPGVAPQQDSGPVDPGAPACIEAMVGTACTPGAATPCEQPSGACEAGYIVACDPSSSVWYKEQIKCYSDATRSTPMTSECTVDEVLFVDDVAGTPCRPVGSMADASGAQCPDGLSSYLDPRCCTPPADAYCVAKPTSCGNGLSCGCASSLCESACGAGQDAPVSCASAVGSVVDCLCGKT